MRLGPVPTLVVAICLGAAGLEMSTTEMVFEVALAT